MQVNVPSRTALTTSLMRAHHSRTHSCPLLIDPWGDILVPTQFREALYERAAGDLLPVPNSTARTSKDEVLDRYLREITSYGGVILRSRYTEDALQRAISRGIRQYVLIGAGFDSFSIRRPDFAHGVSVFEVDHSATQDLKLQRMAECQIPRPGSTHFVSADLAKDDLSAVLRRSSFRFDQPAFFSWLGVTIYLTQEANTASIRAIASCSASGSELVFTYLDEKALDPALQSESFRRMQRNAASLGEPFLSSFNPALMQAYMAENGFTLSEDLGGLELALLYDTGAENPLVSSPLSRIALAQVARKEGAK
jgi:methyltransferase (TIGR00027 family)